MPARFAACLIDIDGFERVHRALWHWRWQGIRRKIDSNDV